MVLFGISLVLRCCLVLYGLELRCCLVLINVLDAFNIILVLLEVLLVSGTDQRPSSRWLSNLRQANNSPQPGAYNQLFVPMLVWKSECNLRMKCLIAFDLARGSLFSFEVRTLQVPVPCTTRVDHDCAYKIPVVGTTIVNHKKVMLLISFGDGKVTVLGLLVLENGKVTVLGHSSYLPGMARCCKMEVTVAWSLISFNPDLH